MGFSREMGVNMRKLKKKYSRYIINKNIGGRVNKLTVKSSEFPNELWLVKDMAEANKLVDYTEKLLERRLKRRKK